MRAGRSAHRMAIAAAGTAVAALGVLTACSSTTEKEAPATGSTTSTPMSAPTSAPASGSTAPAVTATEKVISPGGGNSFSQTVDPTQPASVCKEIVGGVCVR